MMRIGLAIGGLALLAACNAPPPPYNVPPSTPINVAYRCDDGQMPVVRYFVDNHATIRLSPERAVDLQPQPSQSGDLFAGGGVTFWTKSGDATLTVDGKETHCKRAS